MFYSNSYLGPTRGTKSSIRGTFVTFGTDGKLPLVFSQIHMSEQTAQVNKGTLTLRINARLRAEKPGGFLIFRAYKAVLKLDFQISLTDL